MLPSAACASAYPSELRTDRIPYNNEASVFMRKFRLKTGFDRIEPFVFRTGGKIYDHIFGPSSVSTISIRFFIISVLKNRMFSAFSKRRRHNLISFPIFRQLYFVLLYTGRIKNKNNFKKVLTTVSIYDIIIKH